MKGNNKIIKIALFLCLAINFVGCNNTNANMKNTNDDKYVAVICKGSQHEFWKTFKKGETDAAEELGIRTTFAAPEDESKIDDQIKMVEKAIDDNADAIMVGPLDTDKLKEVIDKAADKGIPVLTFDSTVASENVSCYIGTNSTVAGSIAARESAKLINNTGKAVIIAHNATAQTAVERSNGFIDEMNSNYKDVQILGVSYCDGDAEKSKNEVIKLIDENPDLNLIYATNEGGAVGACQAVEAKGMTGKIKIVGFDSSDAEIEYLNKGILNGMILQNPYNMGYLGMRNLYKLLNGKVIEKRIDTGATFVNKDNFNDEDIQQLLYPMGKDK